MVIRKIYTFKFTPHDLDCIDAIGRATRHDTRAGAIRAAVAFAALHLDIKLPAPPEPPKKNPKKSSKKT